MRSIWRVVVGIVSMVVGLLGGPVWAANTHGNLNEAAERQAWFGDLLPPMAPSASACVQPSVLGALTMEEVACTVYLRLANGQMLYVQQSAVNIGPLAEGDGTYWLVVHRNTRGTVDDWTRQATTHFLWKKSATHPVLPADSLLVAQITVSGGAVTTWSSQIPHSLAEALVGVVRAEDYGAVFRPGGATAVTDEDCGAAIMAAQAALPATGGTILLGRGACQVLSTIVLTKRVILAGHGTVTRSADIPPTMLVKASTLSGPAIQVGDHAGLNYLASKSLLRDFALYGENGNTGDGIMILDHAVTLERVSVFFMGQDGIRVGTDSTPRCDCNLWRMEEVVARENGRDGIRVQHWDDGNAPDANGGVLLHGDVAFNGGVGLNLQNTWVNHVYGLVATANVSFGLAFGNRTAYNHVLGADLAEGNCTGGCGGTPYDVLFDGGPTNPPIANTLHATTLFEDRVLDLTPKPWSNSYQVIKPGSAGTRLQGYLSIGFSNITESPTLPAVTHFSARSGTKTIDFPEIAAGVRALETMEMPDFTGTTKTCVCDPATDLSTGLVWTSYATDGLCTISMHNYSGVPIDPLSGLWRCVGLLFPVTP